MPFRPCPSRRTSGPLISHSKEHKQMLCQLSASRKCYKADKCRTSAQIDIRMGRGHKHGSQVLIKLSKCQYPRPTKPCQKNTFQAAFALISVAWQAEGGWRWEWGGKGKGNEQDEEPGLICCCLENTLAKQFQFSPQPTTRK